MKAFYFSNEAKTLRYGDNRKIRTGITHKVKGKPVLCKNGFHASIKPLDALKYAPGSYLWFVELGGKIVKGGDKCCATERTYISGFNAEELSHEFSRKCAAVNIEKIKPYCTGKDYQLILKWLKTGDEGLREAACSAANSAARSAADSHEYAAYSAEYAAGSAVYSAARSVIYSPTRSAAYSSEYSARSTAQSVDYFARSAANSAARNDLNQMLLEMILEKRPEWRGEL